MNLKLNLAQKLIVLICLSTFSCVLMVVFLLSFYNKEASYDHSLQEIEHLQQALLISVIENQHINIDPTVKKSVILELNLINKKIGALKKTLPLQFAADLKAIDKLVLDFSRSFLKNIANTKKLQKQKSKIDNLLDGIQFSSLQLRHKSTDEHLQKALQNIAFWSSRMHNLFNKDLLLEQNVVHFWANYKIAFDKIAKSANQIKHLVNKSSNFLTKKFYKNLQVSLLVLKKLAPDMASYVTENETLVVHISSIEKKSTQKSLKLKKTFKVFVEQKKSEIRIWQIASICFIVFLLIFASSALATEINQSEQALRESEKRLLTVVTNVPVILFSFDKNGIITLSEGKGLYALGFVPGQLVGTSVFDLYQTLPEINESIRRALDGENFTVTQYIEQIIIETHFYPFTENGKVMGVLGLAVDITEYRTAEKELKIARDVAQKANQAKSEFLTNTNHELRTPLNAIIGYAQILKKDVSLSAQHKKAIDTIYNCSSHLLIMITDILDLSKIEAGKLALEPQRFDLLNFLNTLVQILQISAKNKGISLNSDFSTDLPDLVIADKKCLHQVLFNLLGNAIKFTEQGEVSFQVKTLASDQENCTVLFVVEDSGIGISPENLKKIFLPFEQVRRQNFSNKGTGLGLAISKSLVNLMNSELYVESTMGKKTKFWFQLDLLTMAGKETKSNLNSIPEHQDALQKNIENKFLPQKNLIPQDLLEKLLLITKEQNVSLLRKTLLEIKSSSELTFFIEEIEKRLKKYQFGSIISFIESNQQK